MKACLKFVKRHPKDSWPEKEGLLMKSFTEIHVCKAYLIIFQKTRGCNHSLPNVLKTNTNVIVTGQFWAPLNRFDK